MSDMRIVDALAQTAIARADAEILLAHVLKKDRTWILAHPDEELSTQQERHWHDCEKRRQQKEPVAYIIGEREFYGRPFFVDRSVLIPRPSTEGLIEIALKFLDQPQDVVESVDEGIVAFARSIREAESIPLVVDIGTGSGCIAITLTCERPDIRVIATDIDKDALKTAKKNAERHGVADRITFLHGHGFDPIRSLTEPFVLLSNPPYIPDGTDVMPDVKDYEPPHALFAGKDRVDLIHLLTQEAGKHPHCVGFVMEFLKEQAHTIPD